MMSRGLWSRGITLALTVAVSLIAFLIGLTFREISIRDPNLRIIFRDGVFRSWDQKRAWQGGAGFLGFEQYHIPSAKVGPEIEVVLLRNQLFLIDFSGASVTTLLENYNVTDLSPEGDFVVSRSDTIQLGRIDSRGVVVLREEIQAKASFSSARLAWGEYPPKAVALEGSGRFALASFEFGTDAKLQNINSDRWVPGQLTQLISGPFALCRQTDGALSLASGEDLLSSSTLSGSSASLNPAQKILVVLDRTTKQLELYTFEKGARAPKLSKSFPLDFSDSDIVWGTSPVISADGCHAYLVGGVLTQWPVLGIVSDSYVKRIELNSGSSSMVWWRRERAGSTRGSKLVGIYLVAPK